MAGILHQFDRSLYEQKLLEPSIRMQEETRRRWGQVHSEVHRRGNIAGLFPNLVDSALDVLREYLEEIDRICRDVWCAQGKIQSPEFIREVVRNYAVFGAIAARCAAIKGELELQGLRTNAANLTASLRHLARKRGQLEQIMSNRYEVEARELEYTMRRVAESARSAAPIASGVPAVPADGFARELVSRDERTHAEHRPKLEADLWHDFHDKFQALANEERGIAQATRKDCALRAYCNYKEHPEVLHEKGKPEQGIFSLLRPPETGLWTVSDGLSENFQARFRTLASRAGTALGCPSGTDPEDFWLHRLYFDLLENNSEQLFAASKQGGMIVSVCVASATFCSRLERKALLTPAYAPDPNADLAKPETNPQTLRPWIRGEKAAWTQLERRGDQIVLGAPSNDTATQIRHDYGLLYWNVRQLNQWVSQKTESEQKPSLQDVKTAFNGTILVGDAESVPYLTDRELQRLIIHPQTPSTFAESTIAKRWGFTHATVKTYLRRKPKKQ